MHTNYLKKIKGVRHSLVSKITLPVGTKIELANGRAFELFIECNVDVGNWYRDIEGKDVEIRAMFLYELATAGIIDIKRFRKL